MTDDSNRYPDLSHSSKLGLDIETYDPNLEKMGPGVYRKDGKILGVSLSDGEGFKGYYNLGHYDCSPDEQAKNLAYLREVLALPTVKVGQNLTYDVDWLESGEYSVVVNGELRNTEIAEALLDENQGVYNLDFMGEKYFHEGKLGSAPQRFCEAYGLKGDFRKWLWKMPYATVKEYAEQDADLPMRVLAVQEKELSSQGLSDLFNIENKLIRCLLQMRRVGVRIDNDRRTANAYRLKSKVEEMTQDFEAKHGQINYRSSRQVAKLLDKAGIPYPLTDKDNPSINKYFYAANASKFPLVKEIRDLQKAARIHNTFLAGSLKEFICEDGLIHCSFYNMLTDEYGTRSGRFSSANPNLQQVPAPARDAEYGTMCREIFVPFEDCWWAKGDYSQIEYRFMAHFASGPGAEELRAAYNNAPYTDYHAYVMELTGLPRPTAKNLNFGVAFGMGVRGMMENFGWDKDFCEHVLKVYHNRAPYIRSTISAVEKVAVRRGYIRTFLHRRARLVNKSKAYIMYNRLMQGSAADLMKVAMLECYDAGVFAVLHPHLTVHDELDVSVPKSKAGIEALREMQHIMENCIKISVPIKVELGVGGNWAEAEGKMKDWSKLEAQI